jgi:potassium-transporting ATPase KdpC subunit
MASSSLSLWRPAAVLLLFFTLLTGVVYPLVVTGLAQGLFPTQANGSLFATRGRVHGSRLIGQPFADPRYLWSRPSMTAGFPYNGAASQGSNLGPANPELVSKVGARIAHLRAADPTATGPVPVDLVTASGSGLDSEVSPAAALYQVARVARARSLSEEAVRAVVLAHVIPSRLGEPVVNVLAVNVALDEGEAR